MSGNTTRAFGIFLFVVIGASALILGILSANKDIAGSMQPKQSAVTAASGGTGDIEGLKNKDTDGDGLSDYDELNAYHTSPYIKDTDSDGIADGTEVKNGTNPNCPEGKSCGTPLPVNNLASPSVMQNDVNDAKSILNNLDSVLANLQNNNTNASTGGANTPTNNTATVAAQIRTLLKQQGIGDNILSTIDDQTLVQMYNESAAAVGTNNSNTNQ